MIISVLRRHSLLDALISGGDVTAGAHGGLGARVFELGADLVGFWLSATWMKSRKAPLTLTVALKVQKSAVDFLLGWHVIISKGTKGQCMILYASHCFTLLY